MNNNLTMLDENGVHPVDKFQRALAEIVEDDMVSIKIHILTEEALDKLLANTSNQPALLPSLQFPQKLALAQAFSSIPSDTPYWGMIKSLNSLRNAVAHPKDHAKKAQRLLDLERMYLSSYPQNKELFPMLTKTQRLYLIGATITGFLGGAACSAEIKREYVNNDQGLKEHLANKQLPEA